MSRISQACGFVGFHSLISAFLNVRRTNGHNGMKGKEQWGPPSCGFLLGNSLGLFICHNAMYVSLCHLAGVSLRPVVWTNDSAKCTHLSLPADQILAS